MKRNIRITFAILAAGLMTHSLSAQIVSVTASQGATIGWNETDPTVADTTGYYQPSTLKTRSDSTVGAQYSWKAYLQFDLSSVWANHNEADLAGAVLTMYNQNDTGRHFDVWGMADDGLGTGGLEGWNSATITANNAPGNIANSLYGFNTSDVYGGNYLYTANGGGFAAYTVAHTQNAYYLSSVYYSASDLATYLKTDTDGLVTFMIDGYNNQGWWNAPSAAWTSQSIANGEISPYLTLTFVPEPSVLSLVALGLGGFFCLVRRRK